MEKDLVSVLLVEDSHEVQQVLRTALEEGGFHVLSASTADQAIVALNDQNHAIRALVTDILLGGSVTGWDVARQAREAMQALPVVYMTGSEGRDWSALGVPNSVLVEKPFAPSQVVTAVAQLLNQNAQETIQ
jgi:DNA-binding response OmpR family regulator